MRLERHISEMSIMELQALGEEIEKKYDRAKRRSRILQERIDGYARQSDTHRRVFEQAKLPVGEQFAHYVSPEAVENLRKVMEELEGQKKIAKCMEDSGIQLDKIFDQYINQL